MENVDPLKNLEWDKDIVRTPAPRFIVFKYVNERKDIARLGKFFNIWDAKNVVENEIKQGTPREILWIEESTLLADYAMEVVE